MQASGPAGHEQPRAVGTERESLLGEALAAVERRKTHRLTSADLTRLERAYATEWPHRLVPAAVAIPLAELLGLGIWALSRTRRRAAAQWASDLLRLPAASAPVRRLARRAIAEQAVGWELSLHPWSAGRARLDGREHLERARARGRGVILLGAHVGGHDKPYLLTANGYTVYTVAGRKVERGAVFRGLDAHLLLQQYHRAERGRSRLVPKGNAFPVLRALLARGELCNITFDSPGDVDTAFLRGRARLSAGAATLARVTGASLVPCFGLRRGLRRTVLFLPPVDPGQFADDLTLHRHLARVVGGVMLAHAAQYYPARLNVPGKRERLASADVVRALVAAAPRRDRRLWEQSFAKGLSTDELRALAARPERSRVRRRLGSGVWRERRFDPKEVERRAARAWRRAGLEPVRLSDCRLARPDLLPERSAR